MKLLATKCCNCGSTNISRRKVLGEEQSSTGIYITVDAKCETCGKTQRLAEKVKR